MRSLSSAEHVVRSSVLAVASLQPRTGWHEKAADFATCGVAVSTRLPGLSLGEDRPCAASSHAERTRGPPWRIAVAVAGQLLLRQKEALSSSQKAL